MVKVVLCDSNVLIEFYKKNQQVIETLRGIGQVNIAVSVVTVAELLFGARNKKELAQLNKDFKSLRVITVDETISSTFLELLNTYVLSHRLSIPDALIAATAITYNIELFTFNQKDFKFIEGLQLYKY